MIPPDLAARLSALEARERHGVQAMRLLHRWMCAPELRPDDRAELTVAIAKADPDYLPPPEPSPTPGLSPEVIARVRQALADARAQIEYLHTKFSETGSGNGTLARINEALRLLDGAA